MYNHLIPKEHLEAIGEVVVSMNLLEWELVALVLTLSKAPVKELRAATSEMSLQKLKDFARALGKLNEPEYSAKIENSLNRIQGVEDRRNRIVHSVWTASVVEPREVKTVKWTAKRKQGLKMAYEAMPLSETLAIGRAARSLAEELMELRHEILKVREAREP